MRLVVLTPDPEGPVVRHRFAAVAGDLAEAGFTSVETRTIPKRLRERLALFRTLPDADLVVLSRRLFQAAPFGVLRRACPRLVYDVDDAVLFRDPWRGRPRSRVRRLRFRRTVRGADRVTAGSPVLVDLVREQAPAQDVHLAPTPVDDVRYAPGPRAPGPPRLGWIGSHATRPYLKLLARPLRALAARRPDVRLAVMADAPPTGLDGVPVEFTPWSSAAEVPFLRSLDVGLMPLTDDPFSRGKCGFKLLQYLACGVPAVASPVGVNRAILGGLAVDDAALLPAEPDAWTSALVALLDDDAARRRLGDAGRARIESAWSARVLGPRFAASLAGAVGP